jgi:hypothetical protein
MRDAISRVSLVRDAQTYRPVRRDRRCDPPGGGTRITVTLPAGMSDHANCVTTGHTTHRDYQAVNLLPLTPDGSTMENNSRTRPFRQGDYLTDRQRLYRVLAIVPAKLRRRAAILEDCETLDAALFPAKELKRMRLQLVERVPAASPQ